jgi:hypothetical protein
LMAQAPGDPPGAFDAATAAARAPGTTVRIDLIGDSTQTNNAGYGRGFCVNVTAKVDCVNMAKGGASTKTFREQGLWERSFETKPDYMLIQFGHNDMESKDLLPRQTTMAEYEANLRRYVEEARAAGIKPVLVTPLTRRFLEADGKIHSDLLAHTETTKKVAADMKVLVIDPCPKIRTWGTRLFVEEERSGCLSAQRDSLSHPSAKPGCRCSLSAKD